MDLIERYLFAIGVQLPQAERADIIAELRDVLTSRKEEREASLGRPLNENEVAGLLKDFGHPITVAGRYAQRPYIVGPDLYPLYMVAAKLLLIIVAAASLIAAVAGAAVHPDNPAEAFGKAIGGFFAAAAAMIGWLTIIAFVIQSQNIRLAFLDDWNPKRLPDLKGATRSFTRRRETWVEQVATIVWMAAFIAWWTGLVHFWAPYVIDIPVHGGGVQVSIITAEPAGMLHLARAAIWQSLFWPILGVAILGIAANAVKLLAQERAGLVLDIVFQCAAFAVVGMALGAGHWVEVSATGLDGASVAQVSYGVNIGFQVALIVAMVAAVGKVVFDIWTLSRPTRA